ncbi:hypothetical protein EV183_003523 [Coemansia sp. RSA 2336]|nr:hypothetical protein EV183_003523 [Coemansia sp. RSA 2336]
MSQGSNGDGPPRPSTVGHSEGEANERAFDPRLVSLTPTSSVAVWGLAGMRYGQPLREQPLSGVQPPGSMQSAREFLTAQPPAISLSHEQRNELLANALSGLPIGRYLSSLEMYQRQEAQAPYQVSNVLAGSSPAALAVAFANANVPAALVARNNDLARTQSTMGLPIATTSTTPALFVNTSHFNTYKVPFNI